MERVVRWAAWEGRGLEHLVLRITGSAVVADGVVVGGDAPFGLKYRVVCDGQWRTRELRLDLAGRALPLHLRADGAGSWSDGATGAPLPALAGCLDVDIVATPFTNTLPIRRLRLEPGASETIRVAHVTVVPAPAARAALQRYTCLADGRLYRFESLDSDFAADLPVDALRLVADYPGLFRRLDPP